MADYSKEFVFDIPIPSLNSDAKQLELKSQTNAIPIPAVNADAGMVDPSTNPGVVLLYTGAFADFTAEASDDTPDDVDLSDGVGSILYFGATEKFYIVKIIVSTAGVGTYTILAPKYYNGSWVTLPCSYGEVDSFKSAETVYIAWRQDEPDDWAKLTVNGLNRYWITIATAAGTQSQKPLGQRIYFQFAGVTHSMTATAAASASATGSLTVGKTEQMTATAAASASATGSLTIGKTEQMTATAAAVSSLSGSLSVKYSLSATAGAVSSATGALTIGRTEQMTATAAASSSASGSITVRTYRFISFSSEKVYQPFF